MGIVEDIEKEQIKKDPPKFNIGDTVKVHSKIKEGDKERVQIFEGTVIKRQGGSVRENFTIRKVVQGIGVEKTFVIHSPKLEKVEVKKSGKVRRAKLFYLRKRIGTRAIKIEEAEKSAEA